MTRCTCGQSHHLRYCLALSPTERLAMDRDAYLLNSARLRDATIALGLARMALVEAHVFETERGPVLIAASNYDRAMTEYNIATDVCDIAHSHWLNSAADVARDGG